MATRMRTISDALLGAGRRPSEGKQDEKKNYAERFSRNLATVFANALRPTFKQIIPDELGRQQESLARTAKGVKKLDVNYSTPELGLGLGVSLKTLNFPDGKSARFTKNYTRIDNELRAEAKDYHERQPYAVMVAVIFLPWEAALDGKREGASSFGSAVKVFRFRANRCSPKDEHELFERVFIGLYQHAGDDAGGATFFDVMEAPPRLGPPSSPPAISFETLVERIIETYDSRNNPPFKWAE